MNRTLLHSIIIAHGDTLGKLADAMGLPQSALSNRMNGKVEFRQNEMNLIKCRYELTPQQMEQIFFADEVSDLDT